MVYTRLIRKIKVNTRYRYDPVPLKDDVKKLNFCKIYLGIIYSISSGVCLLIGAIITRRLSHYHTSELIAYRVAIEIVILIPILIQQRIKFTFWSQAPLLLLRGALMSCTFFFRVFAIQSLPLSESEALLSSSPIVTAILSRVFLKYRFTNVKVSALVTNVIGLVLICHFWTGFDLERYLGIGSGFLFLLVISSARIVLKKLTTDMQPKMTVFHVSWMRFVTMLAVTEISNGLSVPTIPECPDGYRWYQSDMILLFLMGIAMVGYSTFEAEAVKLEKPSTVAAVRALISLSLCIISQMIIFNNVPSVVVVVGVILVLVSSLLVNADGIVEKMNPESKLRRLVSKFNNF